MGTAQANGTRCETLEAALAREQERLDGSGGAVDLAGVLHDARTPLSVIVASAGIALRDAPEGLRAHLERVRRSARLCEAVLVKALERLRTAPQVPAPDLGALILAAAELPPGGALTLGAELIRDGGGEPFSVRATVDRGGARDLEEEVPPGARRAVLRRGGALWAEPRPGGGTRFVAEIPWSRPA